MTLIRAIAFLLHFTLVPVAIGRLITYRQSKEQPEDPVATYIIGLFASFGIFYVFCSALVWHQFWNTFNEPFTGCFTALCIVYSVAIAILFVLWLIKDRHAIRGIHSAFNRCGIDIANQHKINRFTIIYVLILTTTVIAQLYFAYGYEINQWSYDDYDYVVTSQDTISSDTIAYVNYVTGEMPFASVKRVVTAWPTYIAYLAKVSGFEVTTICHTIMPVILLLIAYLVYYYISKFLFKDRENRLVFLILLSTLNIFGFYSHYSPVFRLLGAIWQGKAVLSAIAIPFFIVYLFDTYNIKRKNALALAMFSLGACSLTTMSILLITAASLSIWVCMCIYKRRIFGIKTLIASVFGVIYLLLFYTLVTLLINDMEDSESVLFQRGRDINWWYKWFG